MGGTRFRARYSSTIPELQGSEGWQESLMQPPETIQDDWNRKGSNAAGSIASGFGRLLPYSSEKEINRQNCLVYAPHSFLHAAPNRNKHLSQICADLQMFKNSRGLLHSCFFLMTCFLTSIPQSPFVQIKRKKLPRTVVFPETEILQT